MLLKRLANVLAVGLILAAASFAADGLLHWTGVSTMASAAEIIEQDHDDLTQLYPLFRAAGVLILLAAFPALVMWLCRPQTPGSRLADRGRLQRSQ